ncbi:lipopolysaccharide heptosyltransferase I [Mycena rebaudengoi]|nr:lipopolysaccharide heptosyltransferase I [Mycena rebaudengoi]
MRKRSWVMKFLGRWVKMNVFGWTDSPMEHTATNTSSLSSSTNILSSVRSSLPVWARDRRPSGPVALFLCVVTLSWLLTPSPPLYTPSPVHAPAPWQSDSLISTSIIIPTYHERANLKPLVLATFAALPPELAEHTEILFVDDDSRDGTAEEVALLRTSHPTVQLLTRTGERGLSSAVLRGFERARGERLVVMDADLQHPPTAIPALLTALNFGDTPMALGTRYGRGVSMDASWPLYRRVISWGARILARPLTTASDPMTGFFAVRKDAFLHARPLSPQGFKIALELLLAIPGAARPPEVPYAFGVRTVGASKLGAKVIFKYVLQLVWLYRRALGALWHVLVGAGVAGGVTVVRRGGLRRVLFWRRLDGRKNRRGLLPTARTRGRLE